MSNETKVRTEAEQLFKNLNKPSLHALSYVLRHPDTWPRGFVWDYNDCKQCAMGLAHKLWSKEVSEVSNQGKIGSSIMARSFGMPYTTARDIFFGDAYIRLHCFGLVPIRVSFSKITPDMVADQIDKYLETAE